MTTTDVSDIIRSEIIRWETWKAILTIIIGISTATAAFWGLARCWLKDTENERNGRSGDEYAFPGFLCVLLCLITLGWTIYGGIFPFVRVQSAPTLFVQEYLSKKP